MKLKVISCKVFRAEIEALRPGLPHGIDLTYLELGEHARPKTLREKLQQEIDRAVDFDAVVLCYGLCGMATAGLQARNLPLILPRSHDCAGVLLGSRRRFEELFRDMPSTPFGSVGFAESGDYYFRDGELINGDSFAELVEKYGEENARYIREAMQPRLDGELRPLYFIRTVPSPEALNKCREQAEKDGRAFLEVEGDLSLLKRLLSGEWDDSEVLRVPPGAVIRAANDWDVILKSE